MKQLMVFDSKFHFLKDYQRFQDLPPEYKTKIKEFQFGEYEIGSNHILYTTEIGPAAFENNIHINSVFELLYDDFSLFVLNIESDPKFIFKYKNNYRLKEINARGKLQVQFGKFRKEISVKRIYKKINEITREK